MSGADDWDLIEWGVAARTMAGCAESGDRYLVEAFADGVLVVVIDGLGHGNGAASVAKTAVAALEGHGPESVERLLQRCHKKLSGTRGVVMSLASFRAREGAMTWVGVGNVSGFLLRAHASEGRPREMLLPRGGVVGYRLPTLYPVTVSVAAGDTLLFATDGIRSNFTDRLTANGSPQQIADRILSDHSRGTDDALVLVARYIGPAGG
jgi:negative regulator of sigma-B (phosphoserine phosphatase)